VTATVPEAIVLTAQGQVGDILELRTIASKGKRHALEMF
jgi:hypothetical protein